ncbi:MAG: hypothetical protein JWP01_1709 [Myxococcales bacterium]|nr:hypothetical protein [Myxococcales bacterium]
MTMKTRAESVDMSRAAITARLEDVRQLYKLCMSLVEAGRAAGLNGGVGRGPATQSTVAAGPSSATESSKAR